MQNTRETYWNRVRTKYKQLLRNTGAHHLQVNQTTLTSDTRETAKVRGVVWRDDLCQTKSRVRDRAETQHSVFVKVNWCIVATFIEISSPVPSKIQNLKIENWKYAAFGEPLTRWLSSEPRAKQKMGRQNHPQGSNQLVVKGTRIEQPYSPRLREQGTSKWLGFSIIVSEFRFGESRVANPWNLRNFLT
jgi:hypothetical protein